MFLRTSHLSEKAWTATFTAGEFEGTTKRLAVSRIGKQSWEALQTDGKVIHAWANASAVCKKDAAKDLIAMWCGAIKAGAASAFERRMGWPAAASEPRGEKRRLDMAAVADAAAVADGTAMEDEPAGSDSPASDEEYGEGDGP